MQVLTCWFLLYCKSAVACEQVLYVWLQRVRKVAELIQSALLSNECQSVIKYRQFIDVVNIFSSLTLTL